MAAPRQAASCGSTAGPATREGCLSAGGTSSAWLWLLPRQGLEVQQSSSCSRDCPPEAGVPAAGSPTATCRRLRLAAGSCSAVTGGVPSRSSAACSAASATKHGEAPGGADAARWRRSTAAAESGPCSVAAVAAAQPRGQAGSGLLHCTATQQMYSTRLSASSTPVMRRGTRTSSGRRPRRRSSSLLRLHPDVRHALEPLAAATADLKTSCFSRCAK